MNPKRLKFILKLGVTIIAVWTVLTLWVQYSGKQNVQYVQAENEIKKALIIYNPDPIYNLDEQVCQSFAQGLRDHNISSKIATVKSVDQNDHFDLYVFCVNTYNWTPDWQLTNFIKSHPALKDKKVTAITVGAGATMRAQRKLEWHLKDKGADLLGSEMYWLLKPNDDSRMKEKNTEVAKDQARLFGKGIGALITSN